MTNLITYREIHDELLNIKDMIEKEVDPTILYKLGKLTGRVYSVMKHLDHKNPSWKDMKRPILSIDFDGVISEYKRGWEGVSVINEQPTEGCIEFLIMAVQHWTVMIFSSRCNDQSGITAIKLWLKDHNLPDDVLSQLIFEPGKPSWYVHIDDRTLRFHGIWPDPKKLLDSFKPWYYSEPGWNRAQSDHKA